MRILDNIHNWIQHFSHNSYQLLALSLMCTNFKFDATHIEGHPVPLSTLEKVKKYWDGKILNNNNVEYLFIGKAKVINIF